MVLIECRTILQTLILVAADGHFTDIYMPISVIVTSTINAVHTYVISIHKAMSKGSVFRKVGFE